jgi:mannose-6-phosphate isomerase-like protein (cupin superfamily)
MTYEIIGGCGVFDIGDSCIRFVQEGEKITIPAGTQYQDEGNLMMLVTAKPPFDPSDVQVLS